MKRVYTVACLGCLCLAWLPGSPMESSAPSTLTGSSAEEAIEVEVVLDSGAASGSPAATRQSFAKGAAALARARQSPQPDAACHASIQNSHVAVGGPLICEETEDHGLRV